MFPATINKRNLLEKNGSGQVWTSGDKRGLVLRGERVGAEQGANGRG